MPKGMSKQCKEKLDMPIVEVTESVIEQLDQYRQTDGAEIGGILIGSIINDRKIRINRISLPCVIQASRCGCTRDAKRANEIIQQEFETSNHTRVYLGEWHTHPEKVPRPSKTDCKSVAEIFKDAQLPYERIIMLIIGQHSEYWSLFDGKRFSVINPIVV